MSTIIPLAGGAIALAGADKLAGNRGCRRMFRHLGWSDRNMQAAALAETAGGLLMMPRSTRRLGGAMVAAVSGLVLLSELAEGDTQLAAPRGMVLLAGLAALVAPGAR
jgi:hypothetical protein